MVIIFSYESFCGQNAWALLHQRAVGRLLGGAATCSEGFVNLFCKLNLVVALREYQIR